MSRNYQQHPECWPDVGRISTAVEDDAAKDARAEQRHDEITRMALDGEVAEA